MNRKEMTLIVKTKPVAKQVAELVSQMTLDEKLAQLGSLWAHSLLSNDQIDVAKVGTKLQFGIGQITRLGGASTLDPQAAAKAANSLQRFLVEKTRLGIPALIHEECCSGAMMLEGTRFPQMLGLASTFQPELAEQMTDVIRRQMRAMGAHQGLAPVLDISRDPRWGRVEETFGEDPTLVSHFGMAYVRGLQGEDLTQGIIATGKHFVGHSFSLGGLNCGPVQMGVSELWNTYLTPFHAAIRDANLASIMNAYPELDGDLVAASRRVLTDLLRGSLGFDGIVVSDYNAIDMIHNYHFVAPDFQSAATLALRAGIDVELPTTFCYGEPLRSALEAGEINIEFIDTAVSRHLRAKFDLGLFENPYVDDGSAAEIFRAESARTLAREIATKSIVLLKNDGLLPLKKTIKTLAVIGPNANEGRNQLGDYSYLSMIDHMKFTNPDHPIFHEFDADELAARAPKIATVLDGIKEKISTETQVLYARGCDTLEPDTNGFQEAVDIAKKADVCILVLGDKSGLAPGSTTGEFHDSVDLRLPGVQEELAKAVIAVGKPVVVVLVNGRPFALPWLDEHANAILEAWLPGEQGGAAVAGILFGDDNPGGKLPITLPRHVGQVPVFYNHKPSGMNSNWYGDYVQEKVTPLYPFGHGLSYTNFEYKNMKIEKISVKAGENVKISLEIINKGNVAGDEVVQLYVRDVFASSPRPVQELKGYARVPLLAGEVRTVVFHLPINQLAFYDNDLNLVVEPGTIEIMLGSSSQDIRQRGELEIIQGATLHASERVFVCLVDIS